MGAILLHAHPRTVTGHRRWTACLLPLVLLLVVKALVLSVCLGIMSPEEAAMRWDAGHFLRIASHGYKDLEDAAFAPLFPLAIRAVSVLGLQLWQSAFVVASAGSLAFLAILCRLYGPKQAALVILIPSIALYTTVPYSESLALPLVAGSLLAIRRRRWLLAGALLGLASLARYQVGIVSLAIAIIVARRGGLLSAFKVMVGPGLAGAVVMLFHWRVYGDPLIYLQAEKLWGAGLTIPLVGQLEWIAESGFTNRGWAIDGIVIGPSAWSARNISAYILYGAGILGLARSNRMEEAVLAATNILLVASLRGMPAVSAARLAALSFPAVAYLAEKADRWSYTMLAVSFLCMLHIATYWHCLAFYA